MNAPSEEYRVTRKQNEWIEVPVYDTDSHNGVRLIGQARLERSGKFFRVRMPKVPEPLYDPWVSIADFGTALAMLQECSEVEV